MTAKEFLEEYFEGLQPLTREESYVKNESRNLVIQLIVQFARLKGKEILEAAADNVEINDYDEHEQYSPHVDRDSIFKSYDLNSIV